MKENQNVKKITITLDSEKADLLESLSKRKGLKKSAYITIMLDKAEKEERKEVTENK